MLTVKNVSHSYGDTAVLSDIDLNVEQGEIICLLGESGSGKTTLLRVIAGLESGYSGQVTVDNQPMQNIPIHKRGFGLMFQDFALFPHMTVAQNVAFGLRMQGISQQEQANIVNEMLSLVGLDMHHDHNVNNLSGGQKQRVALARSLAPQPKLLMLDEPLGSLDAGLRERLVLELREIIQKIGLTAIYVTHDQHEAYAIADRIAIMNSGKIEQLDKPETLYQHPKTRFVAEFLGLNNIVAASDLNDFVQVSSKASHYLIHPHSISLSLDSKLQAIVTERLFQGDRYRLRVAIGNSVNLIFYQSATMDVPQISDKISIKIDDTAIVPLLS